MAAITIKIEGWEKYNPRKDFKRPQWFAFSNRMIEDADFFEFSAEEFKGWIYILSLASQKNSQEILINPKHALNICNISLASLNGSIRKLQNLGIISTCKLPRTRHVQLTNSTEQTEQNKQTDITIHPIAPGQAPGVLDFERVYFVYPRKEGKMKGIQKLKGQIKTYDELVQFATAVKNYRDACAVKKTEMKFIKHFSTFVGSWEEWLDPATGSGEDFSKKKSAEDDKFWEEQRRLEAERMAK